MNLDDLLGGRDLAEMTDDEIQAIVNKLNERDLARFQEKLQTAKSPRSGKRAPSKAKAQRADEFERLMASKARG